MIRSLLLLTVALPMLGAACASPPAGVAVAAAPWPEAIREIATAEQAEMLAKRFPWSGGVQRRRIALALESNDKTAAREGLHELAAMGGVLTQRSQDLVAKLVGAADMAEFAAAFRANAEPLAASQEHAILAAEHDVVEGLAWDPARRRLHATSAADGSVIDVASGRAAALPEAGSLLGAVFDGSRNRIWVASAALEDLGKGTGFSGLIALDAEQSETDRIAAPEGATPGDVTVAQDGTLFVSDGQTGAVLVCSPGCASLAPLLAPGALFSAQGLALSADQRRLYIADYRYGIAVLDRSSGQLFQLTADGAAMLDGIDGLAWHQGALIAIQNAYAPARILRIPLSSDGMRALRIEVLERANPAWGEVTLGTIADDRLFYVADAQWARFDGLEAGAAPAPGRPSAIRSLLLPD